ncbi:MAG: TubC N-terminal docking domain-related protein, partial [Pyrinomonadaceae bacterium]
MSARELLVQLQEKGVDVKANGDRRVIDAPRGAITPDLRDALSANKAELLQILTAPPIERPLPKPAPGHIQAPVAAPEPAAVQRDAPSRSSEPEAISPERSSVIEETNQLEV